MVHQPELSSLTLDTLLLQYKVYWIHLLTDKAVLISQDSGTDAVGALDMSTNGTIVVGGSSDHIVKQEPQMLLQV